MSSRGGGDGDGDVCGDVEVILSPSSSEGASPSEGNGDGLLVVRSTDEAAVSCRPPGECGLSVVPSTNEGMSSSGGDGDRDSILITSISLFTGTGLTSCGGGEEENALKRPDSGTSGCHSVGRSFLRGGCQRPRDIVETAVTSV